MESSSMLMLKQLKLEIRSRFIREQRFSGDVSHVWLLCREMNFSEAETQAVLHDLEQVKNPAVATITGRIIFENGLPVGVER